MEQKVKPAYTALIDYFVALKPKGAGALRRLAPVDGDAYYACVRQHTTTDMTPDQLYELAWQNVARITEQMNAILVAKGLTEGHRARAAARPRCAAVPEHA